MLYVVHHDFEGKTLAGEMKSFVRGSEFETIGIYIAYENAAICTTTSLTAHKHFARNDDGNGLERGDITYALAYAERENGESFRFTEEERELLCEKWKKYLKPLDMIIFNHEFFNADIEDLREMAKDFIKT